MKLLKTRPFAALVKVPFPGPTPDSIDEQTFTGQFIALPTSELKEFKLATEDEKRAFLHRVFTGWSGILDDEEAEDVPLEVTAANRERLLGDLFVLQAVLATYVQSMAGAKRGN
jgi:hypothetical protein